MKAVSWWCESAFKLNPLTSLFLNMEKVVRLCNIFWMSHFSGELGLTAFDVDSQLYGGVKKRAAFDRTVVSFTQHRNENPNCFWRLFFPLLVEASSWRMFDPLCFHLLFLSHTIVYPEVKRSCHYETSERHWTPSNNWRSWELWGKMLTR